MKISHKALVAAVILKNCMNSVQGEGISCQASPGTGNYIIHEESDDHLDHLGAISISSNVPVTIQRYTDDKFMFEQQPVGENEAKVLVTSNCQNADFIPLVTWDAESIDVYVQGVDAPSDLKFIDSSSYHAEWSYEIPNCSSDLNDIEVLPARRRLNDGSAIPPKPASQSALQHVMEVLGVIISSNECTVNVEIMLDGYSHDVDVTAPSTRIIDSNFQNTYFAYNSQNNCVVDVKTDIIFVEGRPRSRPPAPTPMPTYGAVPGRPFVDSLGNTLMAPSFTVPNLPREDKSWSTVANAQEGAPSTSFDNSTVVNDNKIRLGKDDLVEAALTAALDEVRHAKTSFDIASRLSGIEVGPGALPASELVFGQDLKALAMAVAKEGCVDETLSALEAAAEVEVISRVLSEGADDSNKYYAIDRDILTRIRDELQIIASEESSHAALAWRTFQWVCTIDSDACDAVNKDILSEDKLEEAFHRRFSSFHGNSDILLEMKESWSKIRADEDVCTE
ncbi:hypothetical protein ACHAWU_007743 [Discostella pseudostelligera]|uniref:Uncharacterized protein n=1 Tax=Discostella pseudostelligera TaxID=259834 RepID=A0ABD3LZV5_9STRA